MRVCPNCKNDVEDNSQFCAYCGNFLPPLSKKKWLKIIIWLSIIIVIITGLLLGYNKYYEYKKCQPYSTTLHFDNTDTTYSIDMKYRKKIKTVYLSIKSDKKIKSWQINCAETQTPSLTWHIILNGEKKDLKYDYINFREGENLRADYTLTNMTLDDYVNLQECFNERIQITYWAGISPYLKEREKVKQTYLAEQERQRRINMLRSYYYPFFGG